MSQGDFVLAIYETDDGSFCNVRVQPETLAATVGGGTNAEGAGPVDQLASAIARKGRREIGVGCRQVAVSFAGAPPTGYTSDQIYIPIMTPARYAAATIGSAVTYLGAAGIVTGKISEDIG